MTVATNVSVSRNPRRSSWNHTWCNTSCIILSKKTFLVGLGTQPSLLHNKHCLGHGLHACVNIYTMWHIVYVRHNWLILEPYTWVIYPDHSHLYHKATVYKLRYTKGLGVQRHDSASLAGSLANIESRFWIAMIALTRAYMFARENNGHERDRKRLHIVTLQSLFRYTGLATLVISLSNISR